MKPAVITRWFNRRTLLMLVGLAIAGSAAVFFIAPHGPAVTKARRAYIKLTDRMWTSWYGTRDKASFMQPVRLSCFSIERPTSLQFGPDGKLYVASQHGLIFRCSVKKSYSGEYSVSKVDTINLVQRIPNYNDDGKANPEVVNRLVTGILVRGTAEYPIIYVTSSDPRIGGSAFADSADAVNGIDLTLDTNSGIVSVLTWNGTAWEKLDLVRGLPRSEEDHAINGLSMDEDGKKLYVTCGGNTNAGAPARMYGMLSEYALSGCILSVDLGMIAKMPVHGSGNDRYVYDLPTLDDPSRPNLPDGTEANDPFGGNDGLNQARVVKNGPVQVFVPGLRNPYDIVMARSKGKEGLLYTIDNGPNLGWGGYPEHEGTDKVTNRYIHGEPGSWEGNRQNSVVNNLSGLHLLHRPGAKQLAYGGHPNPIRANPAGAGWFWVDSGHHYSEKPTRDWPPVPIDMANPLEGDFRNSGFDDDALTVFFSSTNGLAEYTASRFFGGSMAGDLVTACFDGSIQRISLNESGDRVVFKQVLAKGFANIPLDVTCQGDFDEFPGTIWVADYGYNCIYILEPRQEAAWVTLQGGDTTVPEARHECGFVQADDRFFLIGGRGTRAMNVFNARTGKWSVAPPVPGNMELNHFQAVFLNDKIYIIGALTGEFPDEKPVPDIYVYHADSNYWSVRKGVIPANRQRGSAAAVTYEGKIYVSGGITKGHMNGFVPWTDVYDPETNRWTVLADAPHPRDHFQAAVVDGKMYNVGGKQTNLAEGRLFKDTEPTVDVYDIARNTWHTLPESCNIPTPRGGAATVLYEGKIVVIGGESNDKEAHRQVEAFDPHQKVWTSLPVMESGRHATQAIVYGKYIFLAAGAGTQGGSMELNSLICFDPGNVR